MTDKPRIYGYRAVPKDPMQLTEGDIKLLPDGGFERWDGHQWVSLDLLAGDIKLLPDGGSERWDGHRWVPMKIGEPWVATRAELPVPGSRFLAAFRKAIGDGMNRFMAETLERIAERIFLYSTDSLAVKHAEQATLREAARLIRKHRHLMDRPKGTTHA